DVSREESLDPENWDELRALGHRMLDDMIDHLASVRDRPVWRPLPADVSTRIKAPLPLEPEGYEAAYQDFKSDVLPYPNGNTHPRFWGWVQGTGTPFAMLAEMLAAGMNPNVSGFQQ